MIHTDTTTARAEWEAMSEEHQMAALEHAARAAMATRKDLATRADIAAADLIGEAWIRFERKSAAGNPRPLSGQLVAAALDALMCMARLNAHSIGGSSDEDFYSLDAAESADAAAQLRDGVRRPTEEAAIADAILEDIRAKSPARAAILDGIRDGYTHDEIAAALGVSRPAVTQMLSRIRADIAAALREV